MIWIVYFALIYLMVAGIRISSLWNKKAGEWVRGRKNWRDQLGQLPVKKNVRIWFHVSSLGEFEQARPVIEKIKQRSPDTDIILSFFSPSGFMVRSSYPLATVLYLPVDLPGNADYWVKSVSPDCAVFVKYDLWPGYLRALHKSQIPALLISAHWVPGRLFASWNLPPVRYFLRQFNCIFFQQKNSLAYFQRKGYQNLRFAGDTRVDRCLELPAEVTDRLPSGLLDAGPFDLVAGSTWPPDEKIIIRAVEEFNLRLLIAPHDISEERIMQLVKGFSLPVARLSRKQVLTPNDRIVVVDTIGLLSVLYAKGNIAYIGGGFGSGIHNTLEAMAHRKPLIFGPAYSRFPEAGAMVKSGGAFPVTDQGDLNKVLSYLMIPENRIAAGLVAYDYLMENRGASEIVTNYLMEVLPYSPEI